MPVRELPDNGSRAPRKEGLLLQVAQSFQFLFQIFRYLRGFGS